MVVLPVERRIQKETANTTLERYSTGKLPDLTLYMSLLVRCRCLSMSVFDLNLAVLTDSGRISSMIPGRRESGMDIRDFLFPARSCGRRMRSMKFFSFDV